MLLRGLSLSGWTLETAFLSWMGETEAQCGRGVDCSSRLICRGASRPPGPAASSAEGLGWAPSDFNHSFIHFFMHSFPQSLHSFPHSITRSVAEGHLPPARPPPGAGHKLGEPWRPGAHMLWAEQPQVGSLSKELTAVLSAVGVGRRGVSRWCGWLGEGGSPGLTRSAGQAGHRQAGMAGRGSSLSHCWGLSVMERSGPRGQRWHSAV